MSLLDALSQGFRGAAGVLSPDIQQQTFQQDERIRQQQEQQKMLMLQHVQSQVQSGAMQPEAGTQILARLGMRPEMASQVIGGPGIEAQQKAIALRKDAAMQRIMSSPEAQKILSGNDIGQLNRLQSALAAVSGDPHKAVADMIAARKPFAIGAGGAGVFDNTAPGGVRVIGGERNPMQGMPDSAKLLELKRAADAKGDTEAAHYFESLMSNKQNPAMNERSMLVLRTLSEKAEKGLPLTTAEMRHGDSIVAQLSSPRIFTDPVTQQVYNIPPMQIPANHLTWRGTGNGASNQPPAVTPVPVPLPTTGGRKPLDSATEKEVNGMGDSLNLITSLNSGFDKNYGNWVSDTVGNATVEFKRRFGDETKMADWWQTYRQWVIDVRREKFGATLTGNELKAFDEIIAKPSQDSAVIKRNVEKQKDMIEGWIARRATALSKEGYNSDAIAARITVKPVKVGKVVAQPLGSIPTSSVTGNNPQPTVKDYKDLP